MPQKSLPRGPGGLGQGVRRGRISAWCGLTPRPAGTQSTIRPQTGPRRYLLWGPAASGWDAGRMRDGQAAMAWGCPGALVVCQVQGWPATGASGGKGAEARTKASVMRQPHERLWQAGHWRGGHGAGGGGQPPPPPRGRPAYAQPLSPWQQVPGSMAFATDSNRPKPLWQPPPTACLTAAGATSEVPSLRMHPLGGGGGCQRRWRFAGGWGFQFHASSGVFCGGVRPTTGHP